MRARGLESVTETEEQRVAARLGRASPAITLAIYAHVFEQARHADELRDALDQGFGHLVAGNTMSTNRRNGLQDRQPAAASVSRIRG